MRMFGEIAAVAVVDDDGGGGWRLEATVDGDGREVGWGQKYRRWWWAASLLSGGCVEVDLLPGRAGPPKNPAQISFEFLLIKTHTLNRIAFSSIGHNLMLFSQCCSRLVV